jgi:hypothetical protein
MSCPFSPEGVRIWLHDHKSDLPIQKILVGSVSTSLEIMEKLWHTEFSSCMRIDIEWVMQQTLHTSIYTFRSQLSTSFVAQILPFIGAVWARCMGIQSWVVAYSFIRPGRSDSPALIPPLHYNPCNHCISISPIRLDRNFAYQSPLHTPTKEQMHGRLWMLTRSWRSLEEVTRILAWTKPEQGCRLSKLPLKTSSAKEMSMHDYDCHCERKINDNVVYLKWSRK